MAEKRKETVGRWLNASFEQWTAAVLSDNKLSERSLQHLSADIRALGRFL